MIICILDFFLKKKSSQSSNSNFITSNFITRALVIKQGRNCINLPLYVYLDFIYVFIYIYKIFITYWPPILG